jgi:hypothetical protein
MKWIKYKFLATRVNNATEEDPEWEDVVIKKEVSWNEINEAIAKAEAHNGEYTIEDDGVEETAQRPQEERISELEEAMELLLSEVNDDADTE